MAFTLATPKLRKVGGGAKLQCSCPLRVGHLDGAKPSVLRLGAMSKHQMQLSPSAVRLSVVSMKISPASDLFGLVQGFHARLRPASEQAGFGK